MLIVRIADVPGYPGYRVDTNGQVWSDWQRRPRAGGGSESYRTGVFHALKGGVAPNSYRRVYLGHANAVNVHRIVLEAFVGPCPPGMEACHDDGQRANASLVNLSWGTRAKNAGDRNRHGTTARGERSGRAKRTEGEVLSIRDRFSKGETVTVIAESLGCSRSGVLSIIRRETWAHV